MRRLYSFLRVSLINLLNKDESSDVQRQYPINNNYSLNNYLVNIQDPIHIINNIYIGDAYNAANYDILKNNKFNIIINASKNIPNYYESEFRYIKYDILDTKDETIIDILKHSYNILKNNEYYKIFIHCLTGNSQSAAIILFYLTQKYNMTLDDANKYLLLCRNTININQNYIDDIKKLL